MEHAELAERFNQASESLAGKGHRVLVRRARGMVGDGDARGAADFLSGAAEQMRDPDIRALADAMQSWMASGGDVSGLTGQAAWGAGLEAEAGASRAIGSAIAQSGLAGIGARLSGAEPATGPQPPAPRQATPPPPAAEPEHEPIVASPHMEPERMPPLPGRPKAPSPSSPTEVASGLVERPMDLSEPTDDAGEASLADLSMETAASSAEQPSGPPPSLESVDEVAVPMADEVGRIKTPAPSADDHAAFEQMPELAAPPQLEVQAPKQEKKGSGGLGIALVLLVAGAGAAVWWLWHTGGL